MLGKKLSPEELGTSQSRIMDEDFKQIGKILRDSVHLSNEQMEHYLEGSLDLESNKPVEDHLRGCCYCSAEIELLREAFQEKDKHGVIEELHSLAKKMLRILPTKHLRYTTFWLGYDRYSLIQSRDHTGCIEVQGLSVSDILLARREDREDPGSKPVAIEAHEAAPIVASLSDFRPVGDFQEWEKEILRKSAEYGSGVLRAFAPIGLGAGIALPEKILPLPRKGKRERKSKLESILTHTAPHCFVEVLKDNESGSIFLRISGNA